MNIDIKIESFTINEEDMLTSYGPVDLIKMLLLKRTFDYRDIKTFKIKYTVPNTAYAHANRYNYEIHRFDDIKDFINKYYPGIS
jgi:hypothetical protein